MASKPTQISPIASDSTAQEDGLADIRHLLALEMYKRYKDDESNIRRQVEEKMRQNKFHMSEYLYWYTKFVKLIKLCTMRKILEQRSPLDNDLVELTKTNITEIIEKLSTGALSDYLDPEELDKCKQKLRQVEKNENLTKLQQEMSEIKTVVLALQTVMESLEVNVEKAVIQGLDFFVSEMQMENFENGSD